MGSSLRQAFVTLNDGNAIPAVGLGVFQVPSADTDRAVGAALRASYQHIDTAAAYRNERETVRAIADSGVPRAQLYVVTTLWNADEGYDSTLPRSTRAWNGSDPTTWTSTSSTGPRRP
ncbi:aldo/keto reductase [Mycobacterium sp. 050134]|uniref:aldo/keto reductase n=1 Tax=Mycobacterium sp. 050134 TaxID=3096111 RepID=UPI002EDA08E2